PSMVTVSWCTSPPRAVRAIPDPTPEAAAPPPRCRLDGAAGIAHNARRDARPVHPRAAAPAQRPLAAGPDRRLGGARHRGIPPGGGPAPGPGAAERGVSRARARLVLGPLLVLGSDRAVRDGRVRVPAAGHAAVEPDGGLPHARERHGRAHDRDR